MAPVAISSARAKQRSITAERHARRQPRLLVIRSKKLGGPEVQRPGHQEIRYRLDARVVDPHRAIVEAARVLQMILHLDEVALQLQEIPIGLELRIGLGKGDEALQAGRHLVLEACLVRQVGGALRLHAQLGHGGERGALVVGVSAHRVHKLRHEVVTPRQLHVDVAPGGTHLVTVTHQPVEDQHAPEKQGRDQDGKDQRQHSGSFLKR